MIIITNDDDNLIFFSQNTPEYGQSQIVSSREGITRRVRDIKKKTSCIYSNKKELYFS